jgi:signal transduction histidine kinase
VTTLLENLENELGGPLNPQQRQWVERADHRLRGSLELLRGLQVLADLETEPLSKLMEPVDLDPIVHEVVEEYADLAQEHRQSLTADLPEGLPMVHGIARLLREVLVNYVTNAIKYAGEGRTIVVRVQAKNDLLRVEVRDNGPGIAIEDQARLFQEFVRLAKGKGQPAGTGLGLSIVRRIAEAHNGQAGVESTPGQGSTFFLTLPAWKSSPQA